MLCSVNQKSSVIVFWNGSAAHPAEIEVREDGPCYAELDRPEDGLFAKDRAGR